MNKHVKVLNENNDVELVEFGSLRYQELMHRADDIMFDLEAIKNIRNIYYGKGRNNMKHFIVIGYKDDDKFYLHIGSNGHYVTFRRELIDATILTEEQLDIYLEDIKDAASMYNIYDLRPGKITIREYKTVWKKKI